MNAVDAHVSIFSIDMDEEERRRNEGGKKQEKEEDQKCVICLEEKKLSVREWRKRDGTMARQFYHARTHNLFCCSGWCHNACLIRWVEENGRLVHLFICPHCRAFECDLEEMEAFREGEL